MKPPIATFQLALHHYQRGEFSMAVEALGRLSDAESAQIEVRLLKGVSLAKLHLNEEATQVLSALLAEEPNCFEALTWLAILTKSRSRGVEAIQYARSAIRLKPRHPGGYSALGSCLLYLRQMAPAIEALTMAAKLAPEVAEHQHNLALAHLQLHNHVEARKRFKRAIALSPSSEQSYVALAEDYTIYGSTEGLEVLSKGLSVLPNSASLHAAAGKALTSIHQDEFAEQHYRRAIELSGSAWPAYASWLQNQGRFEEANSIYGLMLQNKPIQGVAYYGLMQGKKSCEQDDALVERMESLRGHPDLGRFEEMHLRYALGRAEELQGRYEEAMKDFDSANQFAYEIHNEGSLIDIEETRNDHDRILDAFEKVRPYAAEGHHSETPVFIIGMIRSGTTLLDQILSSHSEVRSAGELRFWNEESLNLAVNPDIVQSKDLRALAERYVKALNSLTANSARATDKMPLNFACCGLIHCALPNAKFVHIRRNPIDTCLSIYTTYFGQGTTFAYRKENIVAFYAEYLRTMERWRAALPASRLLEIDYEDLTSSPESVIPKVVEFCDLRWEDGCLHHDKAKGAINTPSRWQARQPIYQSSIERWRRYEPWLGEFAKLSKK